MGQVCKSCEMPVENFGDGEPHICPACAKASCGDCCDEDGRCLECAQTITIREAREAVKWFRELAETACSKDARLSSQMHLEALERAVDVLEKDNA